VTDPCKTFALLIESPCFIEKEPAGWKCDEEQVIIRHGLLTTRRYEGFLISMRFTCLLSCFVVLAACGSQPALPVASPLEVEPIASDSDTSKHLSPTLPPEACSDDVEECLPPSRWVSKLCSGIHPEVALHMFRGGSPWTRLYSRSTAPAFNGAGGPSLSDERVGMGEELIALRRNSDGRQSAAGEMSVGDTAGYDLLRWNGSCVTLHDGEYSTKPPRRRQHARVEWRWLGDEVQAALKSDDDVSRAYLARRKECKGATMGEVSKKCVQQDNSLVTAIVDYVRAGGALPEPSERL